MDYPEIVIVNNKEYKINYDFRVVIKCNQIAEDKTIGDYERAMAIICLLFGDEALDDSKENPEILAEFLELAKKFFLCGQEKKEDQNEPDMDFIEDYGYIWASFMSDYNGMDIDKQNIHWWKFNELLNGLSNSEFGNCCILNKIRNLRNIKLNEIKDVKEREKIRKQQEMFALKKNKKEFNLTKEQEESMEKLNKLIGL